MQEPDEFETKVGAELLNLEMTSADLKAPLKDLYITAAKEVDCGGGKKAIILYVPYKLLKSFKAINTKLVRELEKKFSGSSRPLWEQLSCAGMWVLRRFAKKVKVQCPTFVRRRVGFKLF